MKETLFERTVRQARQRQSVDMDVALRFARGGAADPPPRDVQLTAAELELVVLALGLLLAPAAARLQARLAGLRP